MYLKHIFYHYSPFKLTELLTLKEQVIRGVNTKDTLDELKRLDEFNIKVKRTLPYSEHISLHIDKIPIDLIKAKFPNTSPYFKSNILYEYEVDVELMGDNFNWMIVEAGYAVFMYDYMFNEYMWDNINSYKVSYFRLMSMLNKLLGLQGNSLEALYTAVKTYRGKTQAGFLKWVARNDFSMTADHMYAATVPHLFIYPPLGSIKVHSINKISMHH